MGVRHTSFSRHRIVCLLGGSLYQQAPLRDAVRDKVGMTALRVDESNDDEPDDVEPNDDEEAQQPFSANR